MVICAKAAVQLLLDGYAGMFHIGLVVAEQERLMAGALRGGDFRLGGFGLLVPAPPTRPWGH